LLALLHFLGQQLCETNLRLERSPAILLGRCSKIEPLPEFLYYEILVGSKFVGVLQINPTQHRPHIISVDLGKVRKGQIVIRRGSGTDGVTINDLLEFFYGSTSTYFSGVIEAKRVEVERMRELRAQAIAARRAMEVATGMPKGSLGGE